MYSYDGTKFVLHSEYESIKNVNELYLDEEGRLWIGTNDNGLSIIIEGEIINVIDDTNGLPSNSVRCIKRDSEGNYYIGTTKGIGIVSLNGGVKLIDTMDDVTDAGCIGQRDLVLPPDFLCGGNRGRSRFRLPRCAHQPC